MKSELTQQLTARLEGKCFPFEQNRFALNIQTDEGTMVGVSTKDGKVTVSDADIAGATVLHISDELMARVLKGTADLQNLYLNRHIAVDGSVMDVIHFRDAV